MKSVLAGGLVTWVRNHTPFRSPCTIPSPWIYINPRATSLSCQEQFHQWRVESPVGTKPYKLEPIRIPIPLDKLVDVPVCHPFGYHREVAIAHCHSQERGHIRMAKGFPQHNLVAEPLRDCGQLLTTHSWQAFGGDPLR